MSETDLNLMEASMEHHVQLTLDFHGVAERMSDFPEFVQPLPGALHHRFKLMPEKPISNVVMLNPRASVTVSRNSDLIGRILRSVRFHG
ncbi:hypothetical protein [Pseudomonas segetis]|uniref:Uncharacterized protein n=1 Tax=Pseudomonas segetis TaxID=298908 RepID=A0A239GU87_9PSED|nr:hypothetical protein [Pseudomonas segetis]SNS72073.1 hypothetical protein SAMN05216255_3130 [Pseudomonas segetis]